MKQPSQLDGEIGDTSPEAKPLELVLNRHERRKLYKLVQQEKARAEKKAKYTKKETV